MLSGPGTIHGDLNPAGIVQPGSAPGTLSINGNHTQGPGGTLTIGTLDFAAVNGFTPVLGDNFAFLLFGTKIGDFLPQIDFTNWSCPGGDTCRDVFGSNSLTLEIARATSIPEPSTLYLFGGGLLALASCSRKKRKGAAAAR